MAGRWHSYYEIKMEETDETIEETDKCEDSPYSTREHRYDEVEYGENDVVNECRWCGDEE